MEKTAVAKNLTYHRKKQGLSQEELAAKTAVTVRTIQRIEKGKVNPHLQTVKLLAAALSIQVDDLLNLENPKEEAIQKKWLLLLHGTPIIGFVIPLLNVLLPLFLWIHKRDDNALYDEHGAKVVNFQITILLLLMVFFMLLLTVGGWGFLLFISIIPFALIVMVANIISAINHHKCYYPLAFPFVKTKRKMTAILWMGLVFMAYGCGEPSQESFERLDGTPITHDSITNTIEERMDTAKVTGMALALFEDNEIAYQRAFGFRDKGKALPLLDTTTIYGASLSKAVFGYIVAHLVLEGILDLDRPLQSYLDTPIPEMHFEKEWRGFKNLKEDKRYEGITARMCLSHTTGFPNWRWISSTGEFQPEGKIQFYSDPGTKYSYSGEGIRLLQIVLQKIMGKGLEELAREIVFDPLGMDRTSYVWQNRFEGNYAVGHTVDQKPMEKDKEDEAGAAGSMETTPLDYSKFLGHMLSLASQDSPVTKLLFSPTIKIKSKAQFGPLSQMETDENDAVQLSYALGWGWLRTPHGYGVFKEGHGEGFQHYTILFPETGKGIMIMSNSDNGESIFKELLDVLVADSYTPWKWENYIPYDYAGYFETVTGLNYRILEDGEGPGASNGDQVWLRETTSYRNGTVLYSNEHEGDAIPVTLGAGQVIKAVEEGLLNMKAGETKELVAPPDLVKRTIYPDAISPDSTLVIKLLVEKVLPR